MKRKIIQIANSTHLVSLPKKWCVKYGVKKGDEIDVEEDGDKIVINSGKEIKINKADINFKLKNPSLVHRALSALYKAGYDEVHILFENSSQFEVIQSTVNQELIGFEIIDHGKDHIVIKSVSNIDHKEFDTMMRRIFMFLAIMGEETLDALAKKDKEGLKNIVLKDKTINKLTDYCRRALNKKEGTYKRVGPGYTILELLEKVGDGYKDISQCSMENNINVTKQMITALSEINESFKILSGLFYNFDLSKMEKFIKKKKDIDNSISILAKESVTQKENVIILIALKELSDNIYNINGSLMTNAL